MLPILAYTSIFLTAVSAFFGLTWLIIPISAALLCTISMAEQRLLRARLFACGLKRVSLEHAYRQVGSSISAIIAAFLLGALMRALLNGLGVSF